MDKYMKMYIYIFFYFYFYVCTYVDVCSQARSASRKPVVQLSWLTLASSLDDDNDGNDDDDDDDDDDNDDDDDDDDDVFQFNFSTKYRGRMDSFTQPRSTKSCF